MESKTQRDIDATLWVNEQLSTHKIEDAQKEDSFDYIYNGAVVEVLKYDPRAIDSRKSVRGNSRNDSFPQSIRRAMVRSRFGGSLDGIETDLVKEVEAEWSLWNPPFKPDLWFIDEQKEVIFLYEIEDTSVLKNEKVARILDFLCLMDEEGWSVECVVFDRYGHTPRKIPLYEIGEASTLDRMKRLFPNNWERVIGKKEELESLDGELGGQGKL
jgi:hypothetical protein